MPAHFRRARGAETSHRRRPLERKRQRQRLFLGRHLARGRMEPRAHGRGGEKLRRRRAFVRRGRAAGILRLELRRHQQRRVQRSHRIAQRRSGRRRQTGGRYDSDADCMSAEARSVERRGAAALPSRVPEGERLLSSTREPLGKGWVCVLRRPLPRRFADHRVRKGRLRRMDAVVYRTRSAAGGRRAHRAGRREDCRRQ